MRNFIPETSKRPVPVATATATEDEDSGVPPNWDPEPRNKPRNKPQPDFTPPQCPRYEKKDCCCSRDELEKVRTQLEEVLEVLNNALTRGGKKRKLEPLLGTLAATEDEDSGVTKKFQCSTTNSIWTPPDNWDRRFNYITGDAIYGYYSDGEPRNKPPRITPYEPYAPRSSSVLPLIAYGLRSPTRSDKEEEQDFCPTSPPGGKKRKIDK
jgi:hypothetical protein